MSGDASVNYFQQAFQRLLAAQSDERIGVTGAPCGQVGRDPRCDAEDERRAGQGDRIERRHTKEQRRQEAGCEQRRRYADCATNQHESQAVSGELTRNTGRISAQCDANSDLARPHVAGAGKGPAGGQAQ